MKVFLVERNEKLSWDEDFAMVIVAEDERHAERKARWTSDDFKESKNIKITEVNTNEEQCVLIARTSA